MADEEYKQLLKALFEKEKSLSPISSDSVGGAAGCEKEEARKENARNGVVNDQW